MSIDILARVIASGAGRTMLCADHSPRLGDNPATISREEQQSQIVAATVAFLEKLYPTP